LNYQLYVTTAYLARSQWRIRRGGGSKGTCSRPCVKREYLFIYFLESLLPEKIMPNFYNILRQFCTSPTPTCS